MLICALYHTYDDVRWTKCDAHNETVCRRNMHGNAKERERVLRASCGPKSDDCGQIVWGRNKTIKRAIRCLEEKSMFYRLTSSFSLATPLISHAHEQCDSSEQVNSDGLLDRLLGCFALGDATGLCRRKCALSNLYGLSFFFLRRSTGFIIWLIEIRLGIF